MPRPGNRTGVRAVSAADENSFRTVASAACLQLPRSLHFLRRVPPGAPGLRSVGRNRNARRKISGRDRRRRRNGRGRRGKGDERIVIAGASADSGAAAFASAFCAAARGADIGVTGSSGFAGARADEAMLIAPACFSWRRNIRRGSIRMPSTSARAFGRMRRQLLRGQLQLRAAPAANPRAARYSAAPAKFWAVPAARRAESASAADASGASGSERIVCRGMKCIGAAARRIVFDCVFSGRRLRPRALPARSPENLSRDHTTSVPFAARGNRVAPAEFSRSAEETESGAPADAIAAANASFGNRWSIQQSRKYGSPSKFLRRQPGRATSALRLEKNSPSASALLQRQLRLVASPAKTRTRSCSSHADEQFEAIRMAPGRIIHAWRMLQLAGVGCVRASTASTKTAS